MKKILSVFVSSLFILNAGAFDLTQELDNKAGNIKLDNNISIDLQENSFDTSVVFSANKVNNIEGLDTSKYDDKGFGSFSLSFKNKSGDTLVSNKEIKVGIIGLDSYKNPLLLRSFDGKIEEIQGEDDLGTYVFNLGTVNLSASYKLVDIDELSNAITNVNSSSDIVDNQEEMIVLENKEETGVNSLLFFLLIFIGIIGTVGLKKHHAKN